MVRKESMQREVSLLTLPYYTRLQTSVPMSWSPARRALWDMLNSMKTSELDSAVCLKWNPRRIVPGHLPTWSHWELWAGNNLRYSQNPSFSGFSTPSKQNICGILVLDQRIVKGTSSISALTHPWYMCKPSRTRPGPECLSIRLALFLYLFSKSRSMKATVFVSVVICKLQQLRLLSRSWTLC